MDKFKINFIVKKTRFWPWGKWHTESVAFADMESVDNLLKILQTIVKQTDGTLEVKIKDTE